MYEPIVKEKPKSRQIFRPAVHKFIFITVLAGGALVTAIEYLRSQRPEVQQKRENLSREFEHKVAMQFWKQPILSNICQTVLEREQQREAGKLPESPVSNEEN